jgi:co-chaperonin GroES (HSP10)
MAATINFNKKCTPATDYVVLRVIDRNDNMSLGGILLARSNFSNERLGFYQVEDVGENAHEQYGLEKGDYVVADRLAQCYPTEPICVMKYVNVIARTNKDNSQFSPLKNMVFVKDEQNTVQNVGGVLVDNYNKSLRIGEVVAMNLSDDIKVPFKKGDKVMLSKGGDSFQVGTEHVYIYKHDMIVAKVEEK